jgi:hypothetical protein
MSSTYTKWIDHGESLGTDIIEPSDMHESHHDDWIAVEEDDDDNTSPNSDLVADLFIAAEWDGREPKFESVKANLKRSVSLGSSHSRFSFLVRLLYIKSHYRISNRAFDALLVLLSSAFSRSQLPKSYDEARKYIRELGLGYEMIHVCKNNYVLFRGDCDKMEVCPKCGVSRWEDGDGSRQVPHKALRNFTLISRLQRIFASRRIYSRGCRMARD